MFGFADDGKVPMETILLLLTNSYSGEEKTYFSFIGTIMYFFWKMSNLEVHFRKLSNACSGLKVTSALNIYG